MTTCFYYRRQKRLTFLIAKYDSYDSYDSVPSYFFTFFSCSKYSEKCHNYHNCHNGTDSKWDRGLENPSFLFEEYANTKN